MNNIFLYSMLLSAFACNSNSVSAPADNAKTAIETPVSESHSSSSPHKAVVLEVIQVSNYSYLRAKESGSELWLAAPTIEVKTGDTVYYNGGMLMTKFESKELKRTFDEIYFVDRIYTNKEMTDNMPTPNTMVKDSSMTTDIKQPATPATGTTATVDTKISLPKNAVSIADILKDPKKYDKKTVTIKGRIIKYTAGVMGMNWVHIKDGSAFNGKSEIVVTTKSDLKDGDIVTFKGPITLNKDLGFGYFFEVLMENAVATPDK